MLSTYISEKFGVDEATFKAALQASPSARGYIAGAVSELYLKDYLEAQGFDVIRIKEKPSGGNNAKKADARGDFYIRRKGETGDRWLVVESKGLKSNSEFRGGKLDNREKVYKFLKARVFNPKRTKQAIFDGGHKRYVAAKATWELKNTGKQFPPFGWTTTYPGPDNYDLESIWTSEAELLKWVESLDPKDFEERAYRDVNGAITILETHQPSKRIGPLTGVNQAAPLVRDFSLMSVDLYLRTGKHEFVFMNAHDISHSPTSPEHLYQNYTIDILVKGKKTTPRIRAPWYRDVNECIARTKPPYRTLDETQIDKRSISELAKES